MQAAIRDIFSSIFVISVCHPAIPGEEEKKYVQLMWAA